MTGTFRCFVMIATAVAVVLSGCSRSIPQKPVQVPTGVLMTQCKADLMAQMDLPEDKQTTPQACTHLTQEQLSVITDEIVTEEMDKAFS